MSEVRSATDVKPDLKVTSKSDGAIYQAGSPPIPQELIEAVDRGYATDSIRECIGDAARDLQADANAQLAALLRDARRYRYLRNQEGMPTPEDFDAAIDADMAMLAEGRTLWVASIAAAIASPPDRPTTAAELQQRVIQMLGGASGRILQPLIDAYPQALPRAELAEAAGYGHMNSKGFANAMGRLSSLGFLHYPVSGYVAAKPVLFLK